MVEQGPQNHERFFRIIPVRAGIVGIGTAVAATSVRTGLVEKAIDNPEASSGIALILAMGIFAASLVVGVYNVTRHR